MDKKLACALVFFVLLAGLIAVSAEEERELTHPEDKSMVSSAFMPFSDCRGLEKSELKACIKDVFVTSDFGFGFKGLFGGFGIKQAAKFGSLSEGSGDFCSRLNGEFRERCENRAEMGSTFLKRSSEGGWEARETRVRPPRKEKN